MPDEDLYSCCEDTESLKGLLSTIDPTLALDRMLSAMWACQSNGMLVSHPSMFLLESRCYLGLLPIDQRIASC